MHSILANTAFERISTFHADHDDSQILLVDEGIEVPEPLITPLFGSNLLFLVVRHEVPALPVIRPRPELGVLQQSLHQPYLYGPAGPRGSTNSFPHPRHVSTSFFPSYLSVIQSPRMNAFEHNSHTSYGGHIARLSQNSLLHSITNPPILRALTPW